MVKQGPTRVMVVEGADRLVAAKAEVVVPVAVEEVESLEASWEAGLEVEVKAREGRVEATRAGM